MSDYEVLAKRVGKAAVDRLVQAGLFDERPDPAVAIATAPSRKLAGAELGPTRLPHAIPYQGSKRNLAQSIAVYVPEKVERWYEPFAGSAAMTIWAASQDVAEHYVIADVLAPLVELWGLIIDEPADTARRYESVWRGQVRSDEAYFYDVRSRFNAHHDPVDLLYLVCRCVKNAVRFGRNGAFTQSVDKRRLGMRPEKMAEAIEQISTLLRGRTEVRHGDWMETVADASSRDFVYMDPPYAGTTEGRDKRYAQQLERSRLVMGLEGLNEREVPFLLSYDGMTGGRTYTEALPSHLQLTQVLLHAGRSSQSTLAGRSEETFESLYLSPHFDTIKRRFGRRPQPGLSLALAS